MTKQKKSRRARRSFSPEFKADVVRICQSNGEKVGDVAKRLSLTETAVRAWVKRAGCLRRMASCVCKSYGRRTYANSPRIQLESLAKRSKLTSSTVSLKSQSATRGPGY
jgi:transposase-like protein